MKLFPFSLLLCLCAAACSPDDGGVKLAQRAPLNRIAYIPPQCFTKTRDAAGGLVQNPCYTCHAEAPEPNYVGQPEIQLAYAFPQMRGGRGAVNEWSNLFVDRSAAIRSIDDREVQRYVAQDNYRGERGELLLAQRLARLPKSWDVDGDGRWGGYIPDAGFDFDARGYDRLHDGRNSGWRQFSYYPFPGIFMPTNGSFDDVLIRLPAALREREDGTPDERVYAINLAILEALIQRRDVAIDAIDEAAFGVDLDHDGKLGNTAKIAFDWAPLQKRDMSWVGRGRVEQAAGRLHLAAGLFPEGTEFLHSVRYLAIDDADKVSASPRMKELRYARKNRWLTYSDLSQYAVVEAKEDVLNPDRPALFAGDAERGVDNALGWTYQGFIEDSRGRLRPQTFEETAFCMGCHGRISATDDGIFSFSRKLAGGRAHGWGNDANTQRYVLPDPKRSDGKPEFASYLLSNRAGDEYRANDEVLQRFFDSDGKPKPSAFANLERDISTLLLPSAKRALALDKAYWLIVREQSFTKGRDALTAPAKNVHKELLQEEPTGIESPAPAPRLALH